MYVRVAEAVAAIVWGVAMPPATALLAVEAAENEGSTARDDTSGMAYVVVRDDVRRLPLFRCKKDGAGCSANAISNDDDIASRIETMHVRFIVLPG